MTIELCRIYVTANKYVNKWLFLLLAITEGNSINLLLKLASGWWNNVRDQSFKFEWFDVKYKCIIPLPKVWHDDYIKFIQYQIVIMNNKIDIDNLNICI